MNYNNKKFDFEIYQSIKDLSVYSGGPTKTVKELSSNLINAGLNLKLITQNGYIKFSNLKNKNLNYESYLKSRVSLNPLINKELINFARKKLNTKSKKIIHDNGIWLPFNNTIYKISREMNIPLVISPHGMLEPWCINYKSFKKKIVWNIYQYRGLKSAKVLHATSEKEAYNLKKLNLNIPIAIIPNGINLPQKESFEKIYKLKDIGIENDGRNIILSLGRIHPKKGIYNLLKVWKNSNFMFNKWRLIIAGFPDEKYLKLLESYIFDNKLSGSVTILGPMLGDKLINIYRNSKIFVLPTFSENFGLVVAEALSYGLPTLTTNGAPWEILEDENAGWCSEPSIEDLRNVFLKISNLDDKIYKLMSDNAFKVSKRFDWELITSSYIKLYYWMLGLEDKPDFII